jgi:hypothetical protein
VAACGLAVGAHQDCEQALHPAEWPGGGSTVRDGHTETWWAADAQLGSWGPDRPLRLEVASTDPGGLPGHSTWHLLTNLPRPATRRAQQAELADIVQLYGLRNWVEQGYKQVKGELGWADFQVRSDRAIRRHWALVCCAFSFCWQAFLAEHPDQPAPPGPQAAPTAARGAQAEPAVRLSWPVTLRAVRAWLGPWSVPQRCWRSWSQRRRPSSCNSCLTGLPPVGPSISICRHSQQTTGALGPPRSGPDRPARHGTTVLV